MSDEFAQQLNRYFEDAFARITLDEHAALPDPGHTITSVPGNPNPRLISSFEVTPAGAKIEPLRPLCPDGSDHCWPEQRQINGKTVWAWVCDCP